MPDVFFYRHRCQSRYVHGERRVRNTYRTVADAYRQIELKAEDLYDKEKVDLETVVLEDVFTLLQCDENGLAPEEATRRLELFGPNKLEHEEQNAFLQVRTLALALSRNSR